VSRGLHGYLTRDGVSPQDLRELGRKELEQYDTVRIRDETVVRAERGNGGFHIHGESGFSVRARMMLLATGRTDVVPDRKGFSELYGRGVYHCPFCDGWEHRDEPLVAYGRGRDTFNVALELLTWSRNITLCSDGSAELDEEQRRRLTANRVSLNERALAELKPGTSGMLEGLRFVDGTTLDCRALFFVSDCPQKSSLPEQLGCEFDETGAVRVRGNAATNVPGLFVAGNVRCGLHLAIMAAAEGAEAAVAINDALLEADLA
jgi:thioredoxin reductase